MNDSEYLVHYGIKGMKWGVRRYQDDNGKLTPAGKKKYSRRIGRLERKIDRKLDDMADLEVRSKALEKRTLDKLKKDELVYKRNPKKAERLLKQHEKEQQRIAKRVKKGEAKTMKLLAKADKMGLNKSAEPYIREGKAYFIDNAYYDGNMYYESGITYTMPTRSMRIHLD